MGCTCHLLRGETCSYCNNWFGDFENPDDIIDPIPGDTLVMLTLDTGGASVDKEPVLTLQQANARKIAERNKRLAQELSRTRRPISDPDGPPSHEFGHQVYITELETSLARKTANERKLSLSHRIPFAWRWSSLRDDLRMGTSQLFAGEE
jgi:hypothetical protein